MTDTVERNINRGILDIYPRRTAVADEAETIPQAAVDATINYGVWNDTVLDVYDIELMNAMARDNAQVTLGHSPFVDSTSRACMDEVSITIPNEDDIVDKVIKKMIERNLINPHMASR